MPEVYCSDIINTEWGSDSNDAAGEVKIWQIRISENIHAIKDASRLLSVSEIARAEGYYHEKDNNRFIVSRVALRTLLGRQLSIEPDKIGFEIGANKKPYVLTESTAIHYNVSHSGDVILIAVATTPIGIDVELVKENFSYEEILNSSFSEEEISYIRKQEQVKTFYKLWTRKEALLKATGKGIDHDMPMVPCIDGRHAVNMHVLNSVEDWTVSGFETGGDYAASIAYPTSITNVSFHHLTL